MIKFMCVGLGGLAGAIMRYAVALTPLGRTVFPWGTLFVNVLGSFVMGLSYKVAQSKVWLNPDGILFLRVGLLGAFTTFSAFSLESVLLLESKPLQGMCYVALSVGLCLGALWLGRWVIKSINL